MSKIANKSRSCEQLLVSSLRGAAALWAHSHIQVVASIELQDFFKSEDLWYDQQWQVFRLVANC